MDHEAERMGLHFCIATSLSTFLEQEAGVARVGKDDRPNRKSRYNTYEELCDSIGEDRWTWPPFLLARSEWLLELIAFGGPVERPDGIFAPDFKAEQQQLPDNEPMILHWLIHSFVTRQKDTFEETKRFCDEKSSPLLKSAVDVLSSEWDDPDDASRFTRARAELDSDK